MSQTVFHFDVIPGDGIGQEVMPEALRVLNAACQRFGFTLQQTPIAWASCDHCLMPLSWPEAGRASI